MTNSLHEAAAAAKAAAAATSHAFACRKLVLPRRPFQPPPVNPRLPQQQLMFQLLFGTQAPSFLDVTLPGWIHAGGQPYQQLLGQLVSVLLKQRHDGRWDRTSAWRQSRQGTVRLTPEAAGAAASPHIDARMADAIVFADAFLSWAYIRSAARPTQKRLATFCVSDSFRDVCRQYLHIVAETTAAPEPQPLLPNAFMQRCEERQAHQASVFRCAWLAGAHMNFLLNVPDMFAKTIACVRPALNGELPPEAVDCKAPDSSRWQHGVCRGCGGKQGKQGVAASQRKHRTSPKGSKRARRKGKGGIKSKSPPPHAAEPTLARICVVPHPVLSHAALMPEFRRDMQAYSGADSTGLCLECILQRMQPLKNMLAAQGLFHNATLLDLSMHWSSLTSAEHLGKLLQKLLVSLSGLRSQHMVVTLWQMVAYLSQLPQVPEILLLRILSFAQVFWNALPLQELARDAVFAAADALRVAMQQREDTGAYVRSFWCVLPPGFLKSGSMIFESLTEALQIASLTGSRQRQDVIGKFFQVVRALFPKTPPEFANMPRWPAPQAMLQQQTILSQWLRQPGGPVLADDFWVPDGKLLDHYQFTWCGQLCHCLHAVSARSMTRMTGINLLRYLEYCRVLEVCVLRDIKQEALVGRAFRQAGIMDTRSDACANAAFRTMFREHVPMPEAAACCRAGRVCCHTQDRERLMDFQPRGLAMAFSGADDCVQKHNLRKFLSVEDLSASLRQLLAELQQGATVLGPLSEFRFREGLRPAMTTRLRLYARKDSDELPFLRHETAQDLEAFSEWLDIGSDGVQLADNLLNFRVA